MFACAAPAAETAGAIAASALPDSRAPRGATLFATLPSRDTGIVVANDYNDPRMRGDLYQEFESSSIGTGVAIGDYDGDGRPDVFVTSKTETCRLFRNLGHWRFEDATERAGVGDSGAAAAIWKQGAAFADVNNDGRLDLYVCRFAAPNLLYINQGDGTFREQARASGLDVTDSSVMAAFGDYDRDGWLDVYVTVNILGLAANPAGQRGYLFHNDRDGTFSNVTERAGITGVGQSHSATWWDYDNDGWPDLYVGHDYGVPDRLYRNNRDGTFTDRMNDALPHTSFSTMGADVGDVNNDGLVDFLASDMATTSHVTDQRFMADARGRTGERADGDPATPKQHRNALLLATDTGRCLEAATLAGIAASDWTWSVRFEDLDQDGRLDLFATNGFPRTPSVDVIRRMMNASSQAARIRIMYETPVQAEANFAFRNVGDLQFEDVSVAWGLNHIGVSFGAAFGDLDGDGDLDLVHTNYREGVTVLRNDSDRGHRILVDLRGTTSNRFGIGTTVTIESALGVQIRPLTLARGYLSTSEPMLHFGLGEDASIRRLTVSWPSGHLQTFENLPVDRRFTITEPSSPITPCREPRKVPDGQFEEVSRSLGLDLLAREAQVNELSAQPLLPIRLNRRGPGIAVASQDDRTGLRLALGGTPLSPTRILNQQSRSTFESAEATNVLPVAAVNDGPLLWLEANGDDCADLLVTKAGSTPEDAPHNQPQLFLGDHRGGLQPAPADALPRLAISVGAATAADFDHDGRLDVFIGGRVLPGGYPASPPSALWLNRGGTFEDVTDSIAPALRHAGMVTSAIWCDVDGDGWSDLLVAIEWGHVRYFHNRRGQAFDDWSERAGFVAAGTGWWTSLATADFNGDARLDFVAGNLGLNTQYQASASHPALLFSGDFDGRGSSQLIEAYYEGDTLYPWRTRRDLGAVFPSLLKRYPRNADYASASLTQIFGEAKLGAATRFAATELRSGVFLSQPDGTYHFEALPRLAQIAPLQGIAAGDFDGDGHADIYALQNSHAPIPAVGWFNGGLSQFLRGDGKGRFQPVPPARSHLVVPGDAKALAVSDFNDDGWPDFFATRNDDPMLVFRNRGKAGRHSLRVSLSGPAGNPAAIGARVMIELADGSTQTAEIQTGSSTYSQSLAACFFGYSDINPPKVICVRWPSGATTAHDGLSGVPSLLLSEAHGREQR